MGDSTGFVSVDPDPLAPYLIAPARRVGDLLFLSGQAAIADDGSIMGADNFDRQLEQTFANIQRVLHAGGSDLSKVIKVTIYLTDMAAQFPKILEARARYFSAPYPADTTVEVKGLALPELLLEVDVIATV